MRPKYDIEIAEHLADYLLCGTCSKELSEWMNSDEKHRRFVEELYERNLVADIVRDHRRDRDAVDAAWHRITTRITFPERPSFRRLGYWVSGIAASLAVGLFAVVTWLHPAPTAEVENLTAQVDFSHIDCSAFTKPTLIQADGSLIPLDTIRSISHTNDEHCLAHIAPSLLVYSEDHLPQGEQMVVVPCGEQLDMTLPDGTKVKLNACSSLRFRFDDPTAHREVTLTGEGYFEVAHNAKRPFEVHTFDHTTVKVLGTKFNLAAYPERAQVATTLVEGSVEMEGDRFSYRMEPAERVCYHTASNEMTVSRVDPSLYTAWCHREIVVVDLTLEEVMKELACYYPIEADFVDEATRNVRIGFKLPRYDDIEPILNFMELIAPVKLASDGAQVHIYAAK